MTTRVADVINHTCGVGIDKNTLFADLGYKPHAGQRLVHASKAARRILACGVRWGKSTCAAMEGLAAALDPKPRNIGWITAPTYDLTEKVFREILTIAGSKLRHRITKYNDRDKVLHIRNLSGAISEVRGKSTENPVSLLGEGLDWLVADECSRYPISIWESYLSQRLIDRKGWALLISSPKGRGWFYDLYKRGQNGRDRDFESWQSPSWENPHLDKKMIDRERQRLPERVFRQEYAAEFVDGAGAVFRGVREAATGSYAEPLPGLRYLAGLDLAKSEDFTVLVIVNEERKVVFVDRFRRIPWELQVARIHAAIQKYNDATVLMDTTGAGEPVFDRVRAAGIQARPYAFTNQSKNEVVNNLSLMIETKQIELPGEWTEGLEELESYQYSVSDAGAVKLGAPSGYHDDCVIALALAAWQVRPRRAAVVAFA